MHERALLAADAASDPAFYNSVAITESATRQISHTKGGVLVAQGGVFLPLPPPAPLCGRTGFRHHAGLAPGAGGYPAPGAILRLAAHRRLSHLGHVPARKCLHAA